MVSFRIAMRFLKSNKVQTMLIVLGIAVGVSVQVFVGSLITSLQTSLLDAAVGSSPQVTIEPNDNATAISDWQMIVDELERYSEITAISVSADSPSFLRDGSRTISILVRGFQFDNATDIYNLDKAVYEGAIPQNDNEIMLGKDLSEDIGKGVGGNIVLTTPVGTNHSLTITGLYDLKVQAINRVWAMTTLEMSQSMFNLGDDVTTIEMKVAKVFEADLVAQQIRQQFTSEPISISDWKEENAQLLSGLQSQSFSSIIIQTFVLASVVIAIASILAIKVLQRSRQIGILKAMGIKDRDASLIFIYEGSMLGVLGAVAGAILGLLLIYGFTAFTKQADGTSILDITADPAFVLLSTGIAILAATLAAAIPARRSSKLSPIEVIRNG
ncbi:MAG TPA: FtsX-like permease family protein [Methanomassiliicoccales archaeon]|nr:FtsX-like permease family protein [Methanomassiliicoccales archaeon]